MNTNKKVKKTKLVSFTEKKGRIYIKSWDKVKNGDSLKEELIKAARAYKDSGEKLQKIIGEDNIIGNTFYGMQNIEKMENGDNKEKPSVKATLENCKRLTELTNLTGKLIHKYGIDFSLIQDTKKQVFNSLL